MTYSHGHIHSMEVTQLQKTYASSNEKQLYMSFFSSHLPCSRHNSHNTEIRSFLSALLSLFFPDEPGPSMGRKRVVMSSSNPAWTSREETKEQLSSCHDHLSGSYFSSTPDDSGASRDRRRIHTLSHKLPS